MLRTGKMALSFVQNYFENDDEVESPPAKRMRRPGEVDTGANDKFTSDCKKLRALRKTLERAGGIFNKCAQLLSLYEEEKDVFSKCIPFDIQNTTNSLSSYFDTNKNSCREFIKEISPAHYKSGSVGLIFRGEGHAGENLILKIRYDNLYETTEDDLKIVGTLVKYMYKFVDFNVVMDEIHRNVMIEMDFYNECIQHQLMYNLWRNDEIVKIPKIYKKYCSENVLVTEYIEGMDMSELIARGSPAEKKNIVEKITYFVFKNLFHNNILYSDIHYGNFLTAAGELYVIDFGCVNHIRATTVDLLAQLYFDIIAGDNTSMIETLKELQIIDDEVSEDSRNYLIKYIKFQYEPWTAAGEFQFTDEWLSVSTDKNIEWMKEWKLPAELLYFNKIPFGLYHILTKMQAPASYGKIMREILSRRQKS